VNAAIGFDQLHISSVLTTRLLLDGWKLEWTANMYGHRMVQYNPPLQSLEGVVYQNRFPMFNLHHVLTAYPRYIETFDMATKIKVCHLR
jgi:hypothetical protein